MSSEVDRGSCEGCNSGGLSFGKSEQRSKHGVRVTMKRFFFELDAHT